MTPWKAVRILGGIDAKNIVRDPLLRWMILFPPLLALLVKFGLPLLTETLLERFHFDLKPYYPLLMSLLLCALPMVTGMVIGFLLLDQRDDRTLSALLVTPLALDGYLWYRLGMPMVLSLFLTLVFLPLTGFVEMSFPLLVLAAVGAAPLVPFYALSLGAFSGNKVQGFALTKAMGVLLAIPLAAWFMDGPWKWIFGLAPIYWPAKLYWSLDAQSGGSGTAMAGILYQSMLSYLLFRRFRSRIGA